MYDIKNLYNDHKNDVFERLVIEELMIFIARFSEDDISLLVSDRVSDAEMNLVINLLQEMDSVALLELYIKRHDDIYDKRVSENDIFNEFKDNEVQKMNRHIIEIMTFLD